MFTVRMFASTTMSGIVCQVIDFDGSVILETRSPVAAVRVAARCNTGDTRLFSSDFSGI